MSDDLVTISTFGMMLEADLPKAALEMEGIRCFLSEVNSPFGGALGGVQLLVRKSDVERAQGVLENLRIREDELPEDYDEEDYEEE